MTSVFRKLLNREFGEDSYNRFYFSFRRKLAERKSMSQRIETEAVFVELYQILQGKEHPVLKKMEARLLDAMCAAVQIGRHYFWNFLTFLVAVLLLFGLNLHPYVVWPTAAILTVGFLYKTWEFVINKYCYIDACIILLYKAALDKVIRERKEPVKW